jgi:L-alanine-DL-glutamate epimerase-like enolase superfamily enzyme
VAGGRRRGTATLSAAAAGAGDVRDNVDRLLAAALATGEGDHGVIERVSSVVVTAPLDLRMRAYGATTVDVVLARVIDRDGRIGTGFTYTLGLGAPIVHAMIQDVLGPLTRGTRVADWLATYATLASRTRRLGRAVFAPALSALDIAVWDLKARQVGLPLHRLLGRTATRVPIYGSGRSGNALTDAELLAGARSYVDEGYTAMKLRVGARRAEQDVARVALVREAVGPDVSLMVDCNEQLDMPRALALANGLADLGVDWIEEPFPAEDVEAHAALAKRSSIAVAAGEHLVGRHEFAGYLRERAAGVLQPDTALTGGITEALRIAALAEAHDTPVAFHSLPELHIQLATGGATALVEHFPILDPLLAAPLRPTEGCVSPPPTPGHGIAWDEEAVAALSVAPRR